MRSVEFSAESVCLEYVFWSDAMGVDAHLDISYEPPQDKKLKKRM